MVIQRPGRIQKVFLTLIRGTEGRERKDGGKKGERERREEEAVGMLGGKP